MPPWDVPGRDVEGFMDALQAFQRLLHDGCVRSEARAHCLAAMVGPDSPLARPSIAPMARAVAGGRVRRLQRFLSERVWAEEQRRWHSPQLVADECGEPEGGLRVDEAAFVTKGKDAAGVARP